MLLEDVVDADWVAEAYVLFGFLEREPGRVEGDQEVDDGPTLHWGLEDARVSKCHDV